LNGCCTCGCSCFNKQVCVCVLCRHQDGHPPNIT
jgi:hypothetical protein